jgi:hypothetical protein
MSEQHTYVSLHGIALGMKFDFPFHQSEGGADYYILHGNAALQDGSGLYAEVAVHLSQVVKQQLTSFDEKGALAPSINAIRKAADTKDIEFLKSNKKQPVHLSSRAFSVMHKKYTFQSPDDAALADFLKRKFFWDSKLGKGRSWITDPVEQQYLDATPDRLLSAARKLESQGLCRIEGEYAVASNTLTQQAAEFESQMAKALEDINAKHAFERG